MDSAAARIPTKEKILTNSITYGEYMKAFIREHEYVNRCSVSFSQDIPAKNYRTNEVYYFQCEDSKQAKKKVEAFVLGLEHEYGMKIQRVNVV